MARPFLSLFTLLNVVAFICLAAERSLADGAGAGAGRGKSAHNSVTGGEMKSRRSADSVKHEPSIMVTMRSQQTCVAPVSRAVGVGDKSHVGPMVESLRKHAAATQARVLDILKTKGRSLGSGSGSLRTKSLWISNEIAVSGASLSAVKKLLGNHEDVLLVREEHTYQLSGEPVPGPKTRDDVFRGSWNVVAIGVPDVVKSGVLGRGVVIGSIDTGVDMHHKFAAYGFRGDYGWYDVVGKSPVPVDTIGHGTHITSTMSAFMNFIGVAPESKWMACRACLPHCPEANLKACAEWMLCPSKSPDSTDRDCTKAPFVINNSWIRTGAASGFYAEFDTIIQCWREAGIIPVFAVGDEGPACGSAVYPAFKSNVIAVGNVKQNRDVLNMTATVAQETTSQGPPPGNYAETGTRVLTKPDFTAPGTEIRAAEAGGAGTDFTYFTGSGMAAAHVSGVIALMKENDPSLDYDAAYKKLKNSCSPVENKWNGNCGRVCENKYPNNKVGYGFINAYKAVYGYSVPGS